MADLYVAAPEDGEDPGLTSRVRVWYEEHPTDVWRPEESAETLVGTGGSDRLLAALDAELPVDARVLDLGCGAGRSSCYLALAGREVVGLDLAMTGLLRAEAFRRRAEIPSVTFARANLFRPPVGPETVDAALFLGTLESSGNPVAALRAAARCLKPDGWVVLQVRTPWAPEPAATADGLPPLHGGYSPEAVLSWVSEAGLLACNADPPLAPFSRVRPLLAENSVGSWLGRALHQFSWRGSAGPASLVVVARKRRATT